MLAGWANKCHLPSPDRIACTLMNFIRSGTCQPHPPPLPAKTIIWLRGRQCRNHSAKPAPRHCVVPDCRPGDLNVNFRSLPADGRERRGRARHPSTHESISTGDPYGTRTRVFAVRGRRPGPLDEGTVWRRGADIGGGHARQAASVSASAAACSACWRAHISA